MYVIDCEAPFDVLTTPGTTIISPNYPDFTDGRLNCQVTLEFGGKVSIVFEDFDVLDNGVKHDCYYNWLEVYDGNSSESNMIGEKLCGRTNPSPLQSTGDSMTLVFRTKYNSSYRGFKIISNEVVL